MINVEDHASPCRMARERIICKYLEVSFFLAHVYIAHRLAGIAYNHSRFNARSGGQSVEGGGLGGDDNK